MKFCVKCGASNSDSAKFCSECALAFPTVNTPEDPKKTREISAAKKLAEKLASKKEALHNKRRADVLFVLDCTGSMQGEIDAIRDSIVDFADTITSQGVRARVGLVEFRDRLAGEEARVLTFAGEVFTSDPVRFRSELAGLRAVGGGDEPESSLDAVMLALRQPFAPDTDKVIVLITDAPPHIPDRETRSIDEVVRMIHSVGIAQFYIVMNARDPQSEIYLKLLEQTRGLVFDLGKGDDFRQRADHFKRTLMSLGKTISAATI